MKVTQMPKRKLDQKATRFLQEVSTVTFSNPFSPDRARLLQRLAPGVSASAFTTDPGQLSRIIVERLGLDTNGQPERIDDFQSKDRELIEIVFLYIAYHRYLEDLDALIEQQVQSHEENIPVPFAERALGELEARGFSDAEALRDFAFFYQLRRAFYFIVRSLRGASDSMQELRRELWNSVFTHDMRTYNRTLWHRMEDFSTLLFGETGTGKGAAAAAIGRSAFIPYLRDKGCFAANFTRSFIAINLSQFPETLIESELFGHRKGAFTGAIDNHQGVFERCSQFGGLFLDEVGEVSVPMQIKLLQVLQERTFTPLGSHDPKRFKGRVIAATNRPLEELRFDNGFRKDFFYRLCSDVIVMPPLRQRLEESSDELPELVSALIERMTGETDQQITDRILKTLANDVPHGYSWPGNVRELEQAVRRILLTGHYVPQGAATNRSPVEGMASAIDAGTLTTDELVDHYCSLLYQRHKTYAKVASITGLDRRTVRMHVGRTRPLDN